MCEAPFGGQRLGQRDTGSHLMPALTSEAETRFCHPLIGRLLVPRQPLDHKTTTIVKD